ncbi:MAG: peptide chain release factor N(5)-glutamine methyltransferase [Brumimicrobium sp.]|nr:peptide chain release factor N(5)-glutamine methyltransferase [Brumimicrobium sp.]
MSTVQELQIHIQKALEKQFTNQELRQLSKMCLMKYLDCDASSLLLKQQDEVSSELIQKIETDIQKIQAGEPVQYVFGTTYFYGLELNTDRRALIPRPETEELVDWIANDWKGKNPATLDIGTGTGCIPLALKSVFPLGDIMGIDKSQDALHLAQENAEKLKLSVSFIQGDALLTTTLPNRTWDIIVSNPPYIPQKEKSLMADHVLNYEPHLALFVSNEDPLIFYRNIGEYALKQLKPNGNLYVEIHEDKALSVKELFQQIGFSHLEIRVDLQGKERMIKAVK